MLFFVIYPEHRRGVSIVVVLYRIVVLAVVFLVSRDQYWKISSLFCYFDVIQKVRVTYNYLYINIRY